MSVLSASEQTAAAESGSIPEIFTATNGAQILTWQSFIQEYPLFPEKAYLLYKVYADLMLQQEYENLKVNNGEALDCSSYYVEATAKGGMKRILVPVEYSGSLDMRWLKRLIFQVESIDRELYLCFVNQDAVM